MTITKAQKTGLLFFVLSFVAGLSGYSPTKLYAQQNPGVMVYEGGIQVDVTDKPICTLLQEISNRASFSCPANLQQTLVSINFHASNRFSALSRLLREYDILGVWDESDNLSRVYVLGASGQVRHENVYSPSMDPTVSELQKRGRSDSKKPLVYLLGTNRQMPPPEDAYSPGMELSISELRKLGRLSFRKPLPENVFRSPVYQPLLRLGGIHSPQDWLTIAKALQVKRHIRQVIKIKTNR